MEVSGLTGTGLDRLVETLATLAEIKELRARVEGPAEGRVLESRVDKGRGLVCLVIYHTTAPLINSLTEKACCDSFGHEWYPKLRLLHSCRYNVGQTSPNDGFNRKPYSLCSSWHSSDCFGLEGTASSWG